MAINTHRHIDSHWLIFAGKGALALIFGWLMLFNSSSDFVTNISYCGFFLLAFSIIEFINSLYRAHLNFGWIVSVLIALLDAAAAFILVLYNGANFTTVSLITIAAYTILRGIFEILIGLRIDDDTTDRFIWIITGICGAVMGIAILNCGGFLDTGLFVRFFGSYVMISGLANLIYGIHNRDQASEARAAFLAKKADKTKKAKKSTKKPAKKQKSTKKSTK